MNILILGSQGFIGTNLVSFFLERKVHVTGCDLSELALPTYTYHKLSILSADFETIFENNRFDLCINAAGSGNVSFSVAHPLSDFEGNTFSVAKVLDTIRKNQPECRYLHISSAAVYGNPAQLPVHESDAFSPVSPYGFHKWMSELVCTEYFKLFKLKIAVIRPFSLYGNGLRKQLLWDLSNKLHRSDTTELYGTGNETRDFISIRDLCTVTELIIQRGSFANETYNVANGIQTSIREVADLFESYFPGTKSISFSGKRNTHDPLLWHANNDKIKTLGFTPSITLNQGVRDYIDWYLQARHDKKA